MITKEEERKILQTTVMRMSAGDKISALRITDFQTEYYTDNNFTMCKITSETPIVSGVGFSKRNPNYPQLKFNAEIGQKIALSSACKDYVKRLIKINDIQNIP